MTQDSSENPRGYHVNSRQVTKSESSGQYQDPCHCSIIMTPQLLTPERCLAQPGQMGPQNQVTGKRLPGLVTRRPGGVAHFVCGWSLGSVPASLTMVRGRSK